MVRAGTPRRSSAVSSAIEFMTVASMPMESAVARSIQPAALIRAPRMTLPPPMTTAISKPGGGRVGEILRRAATGSADRANSRPAHQRLARRASPGPASSSLVTIGPASASRKRRPVRRRFKGSSDLQPPARRLRPRSPGPPPFRCPRRGRSGRRRSARPARRPCLRSPSATWVDRLRRSCTKGCSRRVTSL